MSVSLRKQFNINSQLNKYARQKKLALCMWYKIIVALQHEDDVDINDEKFMFIREHNIVWKNDCFLCHLFMCVANSSCTMCPLERKYKGKAAYGCALGEEEQITPWARVTAYSAPKEERIAAAWEIVEAIKSV